VQPGQSLHDGESSLSPAVIHLAKVFAEAVAPSREPVHHAMAGSKPHPLLSMNEAAAMLGVSRMTVDRAIKSGEFPSVRFRRTYKVPRAFIEQLLQAAVAGQQVVVEEYAAAWQASVKATEASHRMLKAAEGVA
jgi:excisionase family DNA binding protein